MLEEEKGTATKYTVLKKHLSTVFDSPADREAHITDFERRMQCVYESEDELMTNLLSLYRAANPDAKTKDINQAVKRKFLQGNADHCRHIFIFCANP